MKRIAVFGCALCIFVFCGTAKASDNLFRGFALKGQGGIFCSLVKSKDFPVGQQYAGAYGGSVGYYAARMSYFAFFGRHQTLYSAPRGLVMYRDYEGYECGVNVRRTLGEVKYLCAPFGVGAMLSGSYDRYALVKQYMAYPSVGAEIFLSFSPVPTGKKIFPVEVSIPLIYAFRQSGHYFNVGISLQVGLCLPQKR
ncbi:MAG: hypothetical protein LBK18_08230 [Prevotellaceae bacterium]|jgi:hypothetical protein|nr:hypothetical protein [Prevotellaceae bacterium]